MFLHAAQQHLPPDTDPDSSETASQSIAEQPEEEGDQDGDCDMGSSASKKMDQLQLRYAESTVQGRRQYNEGQNTHDTRNEHAMQFPVTHSLCSRSALCLQIVARCFTLCLRSRSL